MKKSAEEHNEIKKILISAQMEGNVELLDQMFLVAEENHYQIDSETAFFLMKTIQNLFIKKIEEKKKNDLLKTKLKSLDYYCDRLNQIVESLKKVS